MSGVSSEAMSWFRAIADTAIGATQGSDPEDAADTISSQLSALQEALAEGSDE